MRVVHSSTCPEIGPICDQRDEPPQIHDQRFDLAEVRLMAAYGLWRWLGVELQVPFRVNHTTIAYARLDGTPFDPDYAPIHHRDETLAGPGDPWLLVRGERALGIVTGTAKLGASLPVGSTEPNPFALGDLGLEHQHLQLGAGTVAPIAALAATVRVSPRWVAAARGQAQVFVSDNAHGYQPGDRFTLGASAQRSFDALAISGGLDVAIERSERWDGRVLQDGNLGRTDVLLGVAATYRIGATSLGLGVKVPVYQDIVTAGDEAGQVTYPAIVDLSVERAFDLAP